MNICFPLKTAGDDIEIKTEIVQNLNKKITLKTVRKETKMSD